MGFWWYRKQVYFISWGKLYEKVFYFMKGTCYKCNKFWEIENITINKTEPKLHQGATECSICGKRFLKKFAID